MSANVEQSCESVPRNRYLDSARIVLRARRWVWVLNESGGELPGPFGGGTQHGVKMSRYIIMGGADWTAL